MFVGQNIQEAILATHCCLQCCVCSCHEAYQRPILGQAPSNLQMPQHPQYPQAGQHPQYNQSHYPPQGQYRDEPVTGLPMKQV